MTWSFKEITKDNIDATYNMLSNNCLDCVNKLTENDLKGKTISICCSTGRIKFHVTYYCAYESSVAGSVIVDITADID